LRPLSPTIDNVLATDAFTEAEAKQHRAPALSAGTDRQTSQNE
jgi:hypothetical protein